MAENAASLDHPFTKRTLEAAGEKLPGQAPEKLNIPATHRFVFFR